MLGQINEGLAACSCFMPFRRALMMCDDEDEGTFDFTAGVKHDTLLIWTFLVIDLSQAARSRWFLNHLLTVNPKSSPKHRDYRPEYKERSNGPGPCCHQRPGKLPTALKQKREKPQLFFSTAAPDEVIYCRKSLQLYFFTLLLC